MSFLNKILSIRFKLLVTVVVITLGPILTAGYLQYSNAEKAVYNLTVSDLEYMTSLKAKELEPLTQSSDPSEADRQKIAEMVRDVAERYYKPNGMNGYAYILDEKGTMLFHPDATKIGADFSKESFVQVMSAKKQGSVEYVYEGKQKLSAFQTLPNGWILAIGSYRDDLLRPIEEYKWVMRAISLIACLVAVLVGFFIVYRLLVPMRNLVEAMRQAESGDLTRVVPVKTSDELGQLSSMYNEMMSVFRNMLKEVQTVSEQVAGSSEELTASASESSRASEQISVAASEIAVGSEKQKERVLATTASLHRIGRDIEQIAAYANGVSEDSRMAYQYAHEGEKTLKELVGEMDEITEKVRSTEKVIRELGDQSEAIMGIITMIREISAQTNLLALNAAIEAARAGEQGRSFAVVANEVRKLAEQSGRAAEEISKLILSISDEIKQSVVAMGETSQAVQQGRGGVSAAGQAFRQILQSVDDVNSQIARMNQAVQDIAEDTEKIVANADEIARLAEVAAADTQEVAAASEQQTATTQEMTAASETLSKMAEKLSELVKRFRI